MSKAEQLITEHIGVWTSAVKKRNSQGRGSSKKIELYGIKKLRELILDLAVRGLLVPQDPNDEPASELLKKIASEKARLLEEGKIKKQKPLPTTTNEENLFQIPNGWELAQFGNLLFNRDAERIPLSVDERKTRRGEFDYYGASGVIDSIDDFLFDKPLMLIGEDGANLINRSTPIAFMAYGKYWVNNHAHVLDGLTEDLLNFVCLHVNAISLEPYVTGTAQPKMNQAKMNSIILAVPPEKEQIRIVAKVDELMALCDQLEQQTESSVIAHQTLVEALLSALTNAANAEAFNQAWQRIAEHFDTLFTTEHSIDQLKQTILQLAVMGKLSSSRISDTPVSQLIEAVKNEKKNTGANKKEQEILTLEYSNALENADKDRVFLKARAICDFITKGTTPSAQELNENEKIPFLKVYNIVNNKLDFGYKPIFVSKKIHETKLKRSVIYPGDVIMNIVGPPLRKVAIVTDEYPEWNMNQALAVFRPLGGISNKYVYLMLSSEMVLASVLQEVKGTAGQDNLSLEQCRDLLMPIPSKEEQLRIVSKVEELMSICDQLKSQLSQAQTTQLHLADAMAEQALA